MDRILARLERRFGKLAVENLSTLLIGGMVLVFFMAMLKPGFENQLALDLDQVRRGQVWRLVTYLFIPPDTSILFFVFVIMFSWTILTSLESEWGAFKFNVFYGIGALGTTAAAYLTRHAVGNEYLNASCFLAFATLWPNYEIRLFLILPIRVKWLALFTGAIYVYQLLTGSGSTRAAIAAALANYLLFFGQDLWQLLRSRNLQTRQAARRVSDRAPAAEVTRVCAICGAREADGADIRVCSCERCRAAGGPRALCLEHARNH